MKLRANVERAKPPDDKKVTDLDFLLRDDHFEGMHQMFVAISLSLGHAAKPTSGVSAHDWWLLLGPTYSC